MTAYESMRAKLAPLGLYSLAQGGAVDCELRAYAAELSGKVRDDLSTAERRALLMDNELSCFGANDEAALGRLIEHLGITHYVIECRPRFSTLTVMLYEEVSEWQLAALQKQVKAFGPVTFNVTVQE